MFSRLKIGPRAISVEQPATWLVFSSGINVAATRPSSDYGRVAASKKANENPAPVGLFLSDNRRTRWVSNLILERSERIRVDRIQPDDYFPSMPSLRQRWFWRLPEMYSPNDA